MNRNEEYGLGVAALSRGDAGRARDIFMGLVNAGRADSAVWLALARTFVKLGDAAGKIAVLDRLLSADPTNPQALIMKADHFAGLGDTRSASSFYLAALKNAPPPHQVASEFAAELKRARDTYESYGSRYQDYLLSALTAKGFNPATSSKRFGQSLDIVLGQRKIFVQEPRYYYFPELPQIQFYDRSQFAWLDEVEQATAQIREELLGVLDEPGAFAPYIQGDPKRPQNNKAGMLNNVDWSAFFLWKDGEEVTANAARCPNTMKALRNAPLCRMPNRSPSILFSLLRPGARIPPHHGLINTRLICHLPLIVPGKCRFRVGNEIREWVEGKAWLFDDTIEHEAWNDSDQTRVILLFDVWRPELTDEEKGLVTSLFAGIDAYSGTKPTWTI